MDNPIPAFFAPAIPQIERLLQAKGYALLAIDGRCGSGKTTFAEYLSQRFPSRLLHMDDFYLPFSKRAPNWMGMPCGNMDFGRFREEALLPARSGRAIRYRRFDCHADRFLEPIELPFARLTLIEGSYSHHPCLREYYDFTVFLTCSPQEQLRRLRAREGINFAAFPARWIPLEERYFSWYGIENNASLILNTQPSGSEKQT